MEEYEELNEELKKADFEHGLLLIVTYFAGRDIFLSPMPKNLSKAIDSFKDNMVDYILEKLNLIELFLCRKELKDFVINRCDLRLDAYDRVKLFYEGEQIGTSRFNYKKADLDKNELKKFFENAIATGRDVCVEVKAPKKNFSEYIVTKNEDLKDKLDYYLENFDDDLCSKDGNDIRIHEILLFHFII
jgi:hypothetical protein